MTKELKVTTAVATAAMAGYVMCIKGSAQDDSADKPSAAKSKEEEGQAIPDQANRCC